MDEKDSCVVNTAEGADAPAPASAPVPTGRMARMLARDAIAERQRFAEMDEAQKRKALDGAEVIFSPRKNDPGWAKPPAQSALLPGRVVNVHNSECCDLVCVIGHDAEGPVERRFDSCFVAGARDMKSGDPGTFEIL